VALLRSFCLLLSAAPPPQQSEEWKQLFNGKDLTGWKHVGPGHDGRRWSPPHSWGMGLLYWTGGRQEMR